MQLTSPQEQKHWKLHLSRWNINNLSLFPLILSHLKVWPVLEVLPHFGNFLPVARYKVKVRNYIHKMDHRIHEAIESSFRIFNELQSLARNVVSIGAHGQIEHDWVGERDLAPPESRFTWKRDKYVSYTGVYVGHNISFTEYWNIWNYEERNKQRNLLKPSGKYIYHVL